MCHSGATVGCVWVPCYDNSCPNSTHRDSQVVNRHLTPDPRAGGKWQWHAGASELLHRHCCPSISSGTIGAMSVNKMVSGSFSLGGVADTSRSVTTVLLRLLLATSFSWMSGEWEMVPDVSLWQSEQSTCLGTMQLSPASSRPATRRGDRKQSVQVVCYMSSINHVRW